MQMKIVSSNKDIVVSYNKQFFVLENLKKLLFRVNDMSWNYGYIQDGVDGIMLYKNKLYYWYTEEGGISIEEVEDFDNLAEYLSKILPQSSEYFYLINRKFILMLPRSLLISVNNFPSDSLYLKNYPIN